MLSPTAPRVIAVSRFLRNQSTHQNNRVGTIKSQKAITNTQKLREKSEMEKHGGGGG